MLPAISYSTPPNHECALPARRVGISVRALALHLRRFAWLSDEPDRLCPELRARPRMCLASELSLTRLRAPTRASRWEHVSLHSCRFRSQSTHCSRSEGGISSIRMPLR